MKRLAGRVDICGLPFRVWLADAKGYPDFRADVNGRAQFGACSYQTQEIWLNVDYTVDIRRETLSHEMLHGIWPLSGVNTIFRMTKNTWDREELTIEKISPYVRRAEASAERLDLR